MDPRPSTPAIGPPELRTQTSATLLARLVDPADRTCWQLYVDRYRPLIVSFSRARGLDTEEAEDFAQTALLEFARAVRAGRYDIEKGRLRTWLFGIVRHQLQNFRRARRRVSGGEEELQTRHDVASEDECERERAWDAEWRKAVLAQCLREVRAMVEPQTFAAFQAFALEERSASDVARELGISENAVFGCKRRVLQRLREMLPLVDDIW